MSNPKLDYLNQIYGKAMERLDIFLGAYQSEEENVRLLQKFSHTTSTKKSYTKEFQYLMEGIESWILQISNDDSGHPQDKNKKLIHVLRIYGYVFTAFHESSNIDWDLKADQKFKSTAGETDDE